MDMNGNSEETSIKKGVITFVDVPFWTRPGFAIPIVQSGRTSNAAYVQHVNQKGKITRFDFISSSGRLRRVKDEVEVEIGGSEVFGLLDPRGNVLVGQKKQLKPQIETWLSDLPENLTKMNFALFVNHELTIVRTGQELLKGKVREKFTREEAIAWMIGSIFAKRLVSILRVRSLEEQSAHEEDLFAATDVSEKSISIFLPHDLLRNSDIGKRKYSKALSDILGIISEISGLSVNLIPAKPEILLPQGFGFSESIIESQLKNIASYSTQEDRLAVLISLLVKDPRNAYLLLFRYRDKATFANSMIENFKEIMTPHLTSEEAEVALASFVPRMISRAHPRRRSATIVGLSRHLGRYKLLAAAIMNYAMRSGSTEVMAVRDQVQKNIRGR